MTDFDHRFRAIFGQSPFPWQRSLYERFLTGDTPRLVNLPTGLGKTSIVALWLLARSAGAALPRRLVYVVNRRTVVDQTTREVERLVENLKAADLPADLAVSTLRGQMIDNRAWSADPSRPAVICGTVDMIGSRLMFCGYGASFRTKPLYAGFLGQDALFVHDEAHLEPAFQRLLEHVVAEQANRDPWPLQLMALSATSRPAAGRAPEKASVLELSDADREHPKVRQRVFAKKALHLHVHGPKDLTELVTMKALTYRDGGRAVLVFLRTVDDVMKVSAALRAAGVQLVRVLAGTMRGKERQQLASEDPVFQRFLPADDRKVSPASGSVFLVSTSAGEVGVNLSADHLICDLSPFDSMAQRFGRVNRFGEHADTEVHVFHPAPDGFRDDDLDVARQRTLSLLEGLSGDASPGALGKLGDSEKHSAFTPAPKMCRLDEIVLDAWSLTTIRDLPGRPTIEPYLHGIDKWEPPQTRVAWRDEVEWLRRTDDDRVHRRDRVTGELRPDDLLDDYPLKPHEWLTDSSSRVATTLIEMVARKPTLAQLDVWVVRDGSTRIQALGEITGGDAPDKKLAEAAIRDATILLPATSIRPVDGFLRPSWPDEAPLGDVSDVRDGTGKPLRLRERREHPRGVPNGAADLRRVRTIQLAEDPGDESDVAADEEGEPVPDLKPYWVWFEATGRGDTEGSQSGRKAVLLDVHLRDVERQAQRICAPLALSPAQREAISLAGALHDIGKKRLVWQRAIGNRRCPPPLAKGPADQRVNERSRYRHELGSLVDAPVAARLADAPDVAARFARLDEHHRELALHLVGAHHGRARPHFPREELFDPEARGVDIEAIGTDTLRRFARLQTTYGRWGLAYLESLLRAADYAASASPSQEENEETGP